MEQTIKEDAFFQNPETRAVLEAIIAPDPNVREQAIEDLASLEGFREQPVAIYLLATRLLDPVLELRFRAVQVLGFLLAIDPPAEGLPDRSFRTLTTFTTQLDKEQFVKLLEVAVHYLAAEEAIVNILKLCSYAGKALGGIVNDRKLPVEIRQQALYFCGEVGYLNTAISIRNLIQRIEKGKTRAGLITPRKKHLDEGTLFPYAVTALGKLEGSREQPG